VGEDARVARLGERLLAIVGGEAERGRAHHGAAPLAEVGRILHGRDRPLDEGLRERARARRARRAKRVEARLGDEPTLRLWRVRGGSTAHRLRPVPALVGGEHERSRASRAGPAGADDPIGREERHLGVVGGEAERPRPVSQRRGRGRAETLGDGRRGAFELDRVPERVPEGPAEQAPEEAVL
jgi:hypothetical protein